MFNVNNTRHINPQIYFYGFLNLFQIITNKNCIYYGKIYKFLRLIYDDRKVTRTCIPLDHNMQCINLYTCKTWWINWEIYNLSTRRICWCKTTESINMVDTNNAFQYFSMERIIEDDDNRRHLFAYVRTSAGQGLDVG